MPSGEVFVHPTAVVEDGVVLEDGVRIWHFAHIRAGARIGAGTQIGKSCYVDAGVVIGARCKVQNFVSIYSGVTLEDEVFVGPSVTFTNDLYPRAVGEWQLVATVIRQGASLGANCTVVCGHEIGEFAMVGAGSVVTKEVAPYTLVVGTPARVVGFVCRCGRRVEQVSALCPH